MATFAYKVKDKTGNTLTGSMESDDRRTAVATLQGMGYWVLDAREVAASSGQSWNPFALLMRWIITPIFGGAPVRSIALFYRQLATMIHSGMTVSMALNSLGSRAPTRRLSRIARESARHVEGGGRLSEAFARYPVMFPELHVSLIQAGEIGGSLDEMLGRIADYAEREYRIRQRMRMTTFYPKILVLAVIFIPALPTLILNGTEAYWHSTLPVLTTILLWIAGLWVGFRLLCQISAFRYAVDLLKLSLPLVGPVVRMLSLSRFYRAFAGLYSAGTSPTQAIEKSSRVCGNWFLTRKLQTAIPMVEMGGTFTQAMERTRVMPQMAVDMLATGEQTGSVGDMVDKVAEFTENEAEVKVHQLTMTLGVLLLLGVCAYIGAMIVMQWVGHYSNIMKMV